MAEEKKTKTRAAKAPGKTVERVNQKQQPKEEKRWQIKRHWEWLKQED